MPLPLLPASWKGEGEFHAQAVRYVSDRDAVEIVTTQNAIPRQWIGALQNLPPEDLAKLEVWPDGSAIELKDRDIHISVDGLITAILPAMLPPRAVAAIFASRGGRATVGGEAQQRAGQRPEKRRSRKSAKTQAA
jgi:Protein of unknown function (DUF2442)